MENASEIQKKDRVLKTLAVGGFVALIIIISWVSIRIVSYLPTAVTSLASIADSVYNYQPPSLVVVSSKNITNNKETVTISWNVPKESGTFTFAYDCADGVAIDMRSGEGNIQSLSCGTNYNVGNVSAVDIIVFSEKTRFTDVPYSIGFIPDTGDTPTATKDSVLTVVNPNISPVDSTDEVMVTPPKPVDVVVNPNPKTATATPTTPKPTTPKKPVTPTYTQTYIYEVPVSNPNGFTDLGAKFLATGVITNGTFINTGAITRNAQGAIQFEVKNFGTKTSNSWTFVAKLPNGTTYTSLPQTALKPNERAILTLGFVPPQETGVKTFNVTVSVTGDAKVTNNAFSAVVLIR
jgi:hypothetical protein